jgi:hypothetical protein
MPHIISLSECYSGINIRIAPAGDMDLAPNVAALPAEDSRRSKKYPKPRAQFYGKRWLCRCLSCPARTCYRRQTVDDAGALQLRLYGYLGLRGKAPGGPEEQPSKRG